MFCYYFSLLEKTNITTKYYIIFPLFISLLAIIDRYMEGIEMSMSKIKQFNLNNDYLNVTVTNLGAAVYQIYFNDDAMLATPINFDEFVTNTQSFGRTVGRTAGRVFKDLTTEKYIDFKDDQIIKHGGPNRLGEKLFNVISHSKTKIVFNLLIESLSDGYFGDLDLNIIYELKENELIIKHEAISSTDSLLRLTFHPYFNLEQSSTLENHELQLNSKYLLDMNKDGMFTNPISVDTKNHNYLSKRKIIVDDSYNLDDIFLVEDETTSCILNTSKVKMSLRSNYDSLVVFTQNASAGNDLTNTSKGTKYASIAIETQNAQNKLPLLKANEKYDYYTIYKFETI